jgi:hypothetical protein
MVRGKPSFVARIWARLITDRPKESATALPATASSIYFWANPERYCLAFQTQRRIPTCSSNGASLVAALLELGFALTDKQRDEAARGKDFVQLKNGPFDLDLIFAPDGIESFDDAWQRHLEIEGFPVCHLDDIIASKEATGRVKDRESLPRLHAFREYWRERHPG